MWPPGRLVGGLGVKVASWLGGVEELARLRYWDVRPGRPCCECHRNNSPQPPGPWPCDFQSRHEPRARHTAVGEWHGAGDGVWLVGWGPDLSIFI